MKHQMDDLIDGSDIQEEQIPDIHWNELLSLMSITNYKASTHGKHLNPTQDDTKIQKYFNDFNHCLEKIKVYNLNSAMKKLANLIEEHEFINKEDRLSVSIRQSLYGCQSQIVELLWNQHKYKDQMILCINLLQAIEKHAQIFFDQATLLVTLKLLCLLSLSNYSLELMINDLSLQQFLISIIDIFYIKQHVWTDFAEKSLILLCQLLSYYELISKQDITMVDYLIKCHNRMLDEKKSIRKYDLKNNLDKNAQDQEYIDLGLGDLLLSRKDQQQDEEENKIQVPPVQDIFMMIPSEISLFMSAILATFDESIIQIPIEVKWDLMSTCQKQYNNVFLMTASIKLLQSMALNSSFRHSDCLQEYHFLDFIHFTLQNKEYFTITRECLRVYNNLLQSYDDMMLWLKFDSLAIANDNSNYIAMHFKGQLFLKTFGNPEKLTDKLGLYSDYCGAIFRKGDGIEIVGQTPDFTIYKQLFPGYQLPSQITVSFWFSYLSHKQFKENHFISSDTFHVLLCTSDGETPLICTDPKFIFFGVANIGDDSKAKDLNIKMSPFGIRFFQTNLDQCKYMNQGWNHAIISFDNNACESKLFLNGRLVETLNGIFSPLNVKYIGNKADGSEPFGIFCDLRFYKHLLNAQQIKRLSQYNKKAQFLSNFDILEAFKSHNIALELKKIINENISSNYEICGAALECIAMICSLSAEMKLQTVSDGIFEIALNQIGSPFIYLQSQAKQLLLRMS